MKKAGMEPEGIARLKERAKSLRLTFAISLAIFIYVPASLYFRGIFGVEGATAIALVGEGLSLLGLRMSTDLLKRLEGGGEG